MYLPGNEHEGVWASPLLETVVGPEPKQTRELIHATDGRPSLRGDFELALIAVGELRRSLALLPARLARVIHRDP